ncbi:hypothetical protein ES705_29098 [subsurface metagenome]
MTPRPLPWAERDKPGAASAAPRCRSSQIHEKPLDILVLLCILCPVDSSQGLLIMSQERQPDEGHPVRPGQVGDAQPHDPLERAPGTPSPAPPRDPIPALPLPVWIEDILVVAARALVGGFLSRWLGGSHHGNHNV